MVEKLRGGEEIIVTQLKKPGLKGQLERVVLRRGGGMGIQDKSMMMGEWQGKQVKYKKRENWDEERTTDRTRDSEGW